MKKANEPQPLRRIPSVEKLIQKLGHTPLPRPRVVSIIREELAALRAENSIPEFAAVLDRVQSKISKFHRSRIQSVINGTGILVHTNLGRAPLGEDIVEILTKLAINYSNLEFDLTTGERGARASYLEHNLAQLCEAEAATIVNNCAAALVLILRHFTSEKRKHVIVSRGELVQIGGGFRIPDILEASGARLCEIGTTNKTTLEDYSSAIGPDTALILKVHRSNFFMDGFVESPTTNDISSIARSHQIPFIEDLGSGAVIRPESSSAIENEPTAAEVIKRGVDLVCFSGDKLLGGPQAGIIAGQESLIKALKREPFFRALRCDKLILAALQSTVDTYLVEGADLDKNPTAIPIQRMMQLSVTELQNRARTILSSLEGLPIRAELGEGESKFGGGTMPRTRLPSITIDLIPDGFTLSELSSHLRSSTPPVIGYISGGHLKLDLRTVFPRQDQELVKAIRSATANCKSHHGSEAGLSKQE